MQGLNIQTVILAAISALLAYKLIKLVYVFVRQWSVLRHTAFAPNSNLIVGHVLEMIKCTRHGVGAWDMMEQWLSNGNDPVVFRVFNTWGVCVKDPAALRRVFQTNQRAYEKDLALSYHPFLPILGSGLVTSDGELWQKQRLLIGPALRTGILDDIIPIAKRAVDRLTTKLETRRGTGVAVDLEEEFRLLTLQVIGDAVLSLDPEECDRVFPALYLPVMEEANRRVLRPYRMYLPILPEWWRFHRRMRALNSFLINYFRDRWQARQKGVLRARKDILDRVMDSIQETGETWNEALEAQLCYEIKTFLLAGHETSAAMLTWSCFELSQDPHILGQVRAEAAAVFPQSTAECPPPTRREVDGMAYTLAVLKEALRKYSVVPVVTRKLASDDTIMGHKLPAGIMVACVLQGTHNMYKDPRVFRPERFLPDGEYDKFNEAERLYKFVPFIQGPRNCLGQYLALLEARVVLSLLAQRFTFRLAKPGQGERHPTVIPIGPVDGLHVYVE